MQPHPGAPTDHDPTSSAPFVATLVGDIDIARSRELGELVADFAHAGASDVRLDLTEVEFMDSAGVGAVLHLRRIAHERGGTVQLVRPVRAVRRVLEVSGLVALCEIVD
jgi:anti-sigma B factor antagonist